VLPDEANGVDLISVTEALGGALIGLGPGQTISWQEDQIEQQLTVLATALLRTKVNGWRPLLRLFAEARVFPASCQLLSGKRTQWVAKQFWNKQFSRQVRRNHRSGKIFWHPGAERLF
jgi:hypothetical protein